LLACNVSCALSGMEGRQIQLAVDFFDLDRMADSGQCFRWEKIDANHYRIPAFGKLLTISQPTPDLIQADCSPQDWQRVWAPYFDMDTDYPAIVREIDPQDSYLQAAAKVSYGMRILRQELWETMLSFIISQNNNIPRIKQIIQRLCDAFGKFPEADVIASSSIATLRELGLGYRASYLLEAAGHYLRDQQDKRFGPGDYAQWRLYLQSYKGIGVKVADCICLFSLGHKEAFPIDTWIRKIMNDYYGGHFPIERYAKCAGVLQQYMFYYERTRSRGNTGKENA